MDRRTYVTVGGSVGISLLAGCGGAGRTDKADVAMVEGTFDPLFVGVDPGTTVVWTNEDPVAHAVRATTFTDRGVDWSFDSGRLETGERARYTFTSPGAYEYGCPIDGERSMCGVVLVGGPNYPDNPPCHGDGPTSNL